MTFVSNAQNFEDVILWRALHDVKEGRYIDIGAHDPFIDSVSLSFYNAGWRGVNVEPTPEYAARLREARPDDTIIEAAVADTSGPIPFFELSGLSSGRRDVAAHHARSGHHAREILVNTVRLEHLLNLSDQDVHWLKVDVEGMEEQVLRSWGNSPKRPWILVIEATFPNTQEPTDHLWNEEVTTRGYEKVLFDGLSCYFVHNEHKELGTRLSIPANVFDAFAITPMHFTAKPLREELDTLHKGVTDERQRADEASASLERTQHKLNQASEEQIRTLERLATAEAQHRQALAEAMEYHRDAERRAGEAQAGANASLVELARVEERNAQLQGKLDRANQVADWAEERAGRLGAELKRANNAVKSAEEKLAEARREVFDVRSALEQAQTGHDQVYAELQQVSAESERRLEERDAADRKSKALSAQIGEFRTQIDHYRAELKHLDALIGEATIERMGRWNRIGKALGLGGRDQAWRALSSWSKQSSNQTALRLVADQTVMSESKSTMNRLASAEVRNPYLRANSLEELLSWQGADFVRCAYVTVLGRQPDPEGETYYTDRIRAGLSKLEVLWRLRHSIEGPRHDPGIAGLDRALRRARAWSWPARTFGRVARSAQPSAPQRRGPAAVAAPIVPTSPDTRHVDASAAIQEIAAEIEALKLIVDGFGHALRGISNAQVRYERQIGALSPSNQPIRSSAPRRSARNEIAQ